ncbi:MAG: hypothetical protein HN348_12650 [Proteobacteria bacterium]|jgi:hypothetical protein|nr:hypothetical protein [Pseudomonadota bacterium]
MKFLLITLLICCTATPVEDTEKKGKKKNNGGDTADVMELFLDPAEAGTTPPPLEELPAEAKPTPIKKDYTKTANKSSESQGRWLNRPLQITQCFTFE